MISQRVRTPAARNDTIPRLARFINSPTVLTPAVLRALMARGFRQSNATGLHLKAGLSA
jgi:hypothetical protein